MRANIWCFACKAHTEHESDESGGSLWICRKADESGVECQAVRSLGIEVRPEDAGCFFDSHRGQFIGEAVIDMAEEAGFHPDNDNRHAYDEFYHEVWEEAEQHLNQFAPNGYYFGSSEHSCDWGLWPIQYEHIWEAVEARGLEYDRHATDLYLPDTPENRQLCEDYSIEVGSVSCRPFTSAIDGKPWLDLAFQYLPEWERKVGGLA